MAIESKLSNIRKITNSSLNSLIDITNLNFKDLSEATLLFLDKLDYDEDSNSINGLNTLVSNFVTVNNRFTMNLNGATTWSIDSQGRAEGKSFLVEIAEAKRYRHTDFPDWPDEGVPGEIIYTGIQNQRPEFGEDFIGYLDGRGWVSLTEGGPQSGLILIQEVGSPGIPATPPLGSGLVWVGDPGLANAAIPTTQELYFTDENGQIFSVILGGGGVGDLDWTIEGIDLRMGTTGNVLPNITDTNNLGSYSDRWNAVHIDNVFFGTTNGMSIYKSGNTLNVLADILGAGDISFTYAGEVTFSSILTLDNAGLRYTDGTENDGYVLTSDAFGNASWQPSSGGGGGPSGETVTYTDIIDVTAGVPYTITHNLGTEYIQISAVELPSEEEIDAFINNYTTSSVDITSSVNAKLRITIISAGGPEIIIVEDGDWNIIGSPGIDLQMGVPGTILPYADDLNDIGTPGLRFKDLYLASVIDFRDDLSLNKDGVEIATVNLNGVTLETSRNLYLQEDSNISLNGSLDTVGLYYNSTTSEAILYADENDNIRLSANIGGKVIFEANAEEIAEANQDELRVKTGKSLSIEGSAEAFTELASVTGNNDWDFMEVANGRIFRNNYDTTLYEHDPVTLAVINTFNFPDGSVKLQYNSSLNRLYSGDYNQGSNAYYLDLNTDSVVSVNTGTTGKYRDYIAYSQTENLIYAYDYNTQVIDIYDDGWIHQGSVAVLLVGFSGYGIMVNQNNGLVYLQGESSFSGTSVILIYAPSGGSLILDETFDTGSNAPGGQFNWPGSAHDYDRNRDYVGVGKDVYVFDGTATAPRTPITVIDMDAVGFSFTFSYVQDISYYGGKVIVSTRRGIALVDPDTYATTVFLDQFKSQPGATIEYNDSYYTTQVDGQVKKFLTVTEFAPARIVYQNTLPILSTHNLQEKDGILAHLADIPMPTSNIVWVDRDYGVDATAEPYIADKPYRTVNAAITAAVSGDVVVVRPGSYSDFVVLKNGVDIHLMKDASVRRISDNGVDVTCQITGQGTIDRGSSNDAVIIRGTNSDVYLEADRIRCRGVVFVIGLAATNNTKFKLRCRRIEGGGINGTFYRPRGTCEIDAVITEIATNDYSPSTNAFFLTNGAANEFQGKARIKINHLYHANGSRTGSLYDQFAGGSANAEVYFDINRVTNLYTGTAAGTGGNPGGWIFKRDNAKVYVKVGEEFVIDNMYGIRVVSGTVGTVEFEGKMTCDKKFCVSIDNVQGHRVNIKNSELRRLSGGADGNTVVRNIVAGQLYIDNSRIIKVSAGTLTGSVVYVNNASQKTFIKNSEIILEGTTGFACDSANIANGEIYFRNTVSNVDNSTNITDIAVVSGFIPNDTALEI